MPLTSRKALLARGAISVTLKPLLATDAKVDLDAALAGVTSKNFGSMKSKVFGRIETATKGKLVADASLAPIRLALDAMEEEACEDEDPDEKDKAEDAKKASDKRAKDRKRSMDKMRAKDGDDDEDDDSRKEREASDAAEDARRAKDGEPEESMDECETRYQADRKRAKDLKAGKANGMDAATVSKMIKAAVDAAVGPAVAAGRSAAVSDMNAIAAARRDVAPHIGEVGEVESARELYVMALDSAAAFDVKLDGSESLSALQNMVKMLPFPDAVPAPRHSFAVDAKAAESFATRFPTAARIGHA